MNFIRKISVFLVFVLCLGVMTSCLGSGSSSNKISLSTDEIYEKAVSGVELPKLKKLSSSELEGLFDLKSSNVEEYTVYISMMNVKSTEIVIFKFENKEQEEAITECIDKRLEDLNAIWSTYLPDQYELVKDVKKFTYGNVKGYVIAEDADKIISNIDKAVK